MSQGLSYVFMYVYECVYIYMCVCVCACVYMYLCVYKYGCVSIYISKVGDCNQGWPEGSLFNGYNTEM